MSEDEELDSNDSNEPVRKRFCVAAIAVIVVVGVGVGTYMLWPDEPATPGAKPLEDVDVSVVESGFSFEKHGDTYWEASVGWVVENTSNQVALAEVKTIYLDEKGKSKNENYSARSDPFYVFPGEKVSGGHTTWEGKANKRNDEYIADIADIDYQITTEGMGRPSEFEYENVNGEVTSVEEDTYVHEYESLDEVTVEMDSQFSSEVDVGAIGLVYRDKTDDIVGGWGPYLHEPYRDPEDDIRERTDQVPDFSMPTGKSTQQFEALIPSDTESMDVDIAPFVIHDPEHPHRNCIECFQEELRPKTRLAARQR